MIEFIQHQTDLAEKSIQAVVKLLDEGATIPFISRYRKEMTGNLDEVQVADIAKVYKSFTELQERKQTVLKSIQEQGKLSDQLKEKIEGVTEMTVLEDLYLPFKPKRQTRATKARDLGLEPLAKMIFSQRYPDPYLLVDDVQGIKVDTHDEAIAGAIDIIAEWISEYAWVRGYLRDQFLKYGIVKSTVTKGNDNADSKYKDYFDWEERVARIPSHRFLAINRGKSEKILKISVKIDEERALEFLNRRVVKGNNDCSFVVEKAVKESFKRLLSPSLENEALSTLKEKSDIAAIEVFRTNLQQLLLSSPVGKKATLAIDPGFRTGCKLVCLSANGDLLHNETIYPHPPQREIAKAKNKIRNLVDTYKIECIAIGNGTAGRETERLVQSISFGKSVEAYVVNEDGASIYSASKIAREEFPSYDVTVRGAVSIGRRLMDPLSELVKIDPQSMGVGQYQHDVNQKQLKESLDATVVSVVNKVGVNLNLASKHLLKYVSGLNESLADKIVIARKENGGFKTRQELLDIPRFGKKAFELSAGFLRVQGGDNPLDSSAVHPENYRLIQMLLKQSKLSLSDVMGDKDKVNSLPWDSLLSDKVTSITINDLKAELLKPGRDPRGKAKVFAFDDRLSGFSDLKEGMLLNVVVNNLTNFGAFCDMGIKESGLIHISQITDDFIKDPSEKLFIGQQLQAKVLQIDVARKRVGLTLKF